MKTKQAKTGRKWATAIFWIVCLVFCMWMMKAYWDGEFNSVDTLQKYILRFGLMAPIVLILIQATQVVIPILPGFLGCAVGAVMFGWMGGFWCNYIGISGGSIVAFLLARKYGQEIISRMFPERRYKKWAEWAGKSKYYTVILFMGMVLPLFPDDFFCYFTGVTNMSVRKFVIVIILGKPWCILAYSLLFSGSLTG